MTRMYMNNNFMMDHDACAAAASSCAHMSAMCSAANMTLARILDAIFMASSIICLICCLIAAAFLRISLSVLLAVLVLLVVLLVCEGTKLPKTQRRV